MFTMVTTRCALIFLVSACLWGMSCTSSIILCTDSPTSFENGTTIAAMLGKPVSVVFCVQCQPSLRISQFIKIIHPNHNNDTIYYYTNNRELGRSIIVNITPSANKAIVNITIKAVQNEDFKDQFSVAINTDKSIADNSVFVFQLSKAGISEPPTVSFFSLKIQSKTGWKFVDYDTDYVTVQTSYEYVVLTCHAEGTPQPRVIITDESHLQFTSGTLVTLAVCRREVFTCTANNSFGSSQAHRRILIMHPLKVTQFTATVKNSRQEVRSGATVELSCAVDGCPDNITIARNAHPIAETANYTSNLVHEIQRVNCSHMGTYTCLAKSPTGQVGQKTADLEVTGCPVSLCQEEDTSREISPTLGENVTFSLCLMSSEVLKYSANETKIIVTLTRIPITSFYWMANITMYSIQVKDYRTHTVRIGNNNIGSLDVHFTLRDEDSTHTLVGQKAKQHETDSIVLLSALPVVCVIILVFIIVVGIVCYRGRLTSRRRSKDIIDCGSGNDNSGEVMYANLRETSVGRMPEQQEAEQQQEAGRLQRQEDCTTTDLQNKESVRFTTDDGTIYFNVAT